jgi:hypothetical protein
MSERGYQIDIGAFGTTIFMHSQYELSLALFEVSYDFMENERAEVAASRGHR